MEKKLTW